MNPAVASVLLNSVTSDISSFFSYIFMLTSATGTINPFFPLEIASKYYSHNGRNPYSLVSMIKAFFVKNIYGYHSISMLIDLLNASPQVKAF